MVARLLQDRKLVKDSVLYVFLVLGSSVELWGRKWLVVVARGLYASCRMCCKNRKFTAMKEITTMAVYVDYSKDHESNQLKVSARLFCDYVLIKLLQN